MSNENVKSEALKLRDLLLKYERKEDANFLEQHVAELDDPEKARRALWSLKRMCQLKRQSDVNLPGYDTGAGGYGWLAPLEKALWKALRHFSRRA